MFDIKCVFDVNRLYSEFRQDTRHAMIVGIDSRIIVAQLAILGVSLFI